MVRISIRAGIFFDTSIIRICFDNITCCRRNDVSSLPPGYMNHKSNERFCLLRCIKTLRWPDVFWYFKHLNYFWWCFRNSVNEAIDSWNWSFITEKSIDVIIWTEQEFLFLKASRRLKRNSIISYLLWANIPTLLIWSSHDW